MCGSILAAVREIFGKIVDRFIRIKKTMGGYLPWEEEGDIDTIGLFLFAENNGGTPLPLCAWRGMFKLIWIPAFAGMTGFCCL